MRPARWLLALAAAWAGGAAGHAGLAASSPPDGATLQAPPSSIELRFTEPVTPVLVRLFNASGAPVVLPAPPAASEVLRLALPPSLGEGHYTLSFRVISLDSHPIGGSIVFAVGDGPSPPRAEPGSSDSSALSVWIAAVRALRDLALLIAAGGALFLVCIGRFAGERALLGACAVIAIIAAITGIGLQGAAMLGGDSALWASETWRIGLFSSFGLSASVAVSGAAAIAAAAMLPPRAVRTALLLGGALLIIGSLPLTGHAMTARPGALAAAALAAHGLAAAFWVGSLGALLAVMTTRSSGEAALALRRFSRLGIGAVAVLLAGGTTFAILQIASIAELLGSRYGWLILGKAALLAALLVLAALNRFRWLPLLEKEAPGAAGRLRWSVAGEVGLIVCVIAVTAVLVQTPLPQAAGRGFAQRVSYEDSFAEVSVNPARAGANTITVRFQDAQGQPFDPEEVLIEIGNEAAGVEPAPRPIRRAGPGHYTRDGRELAFPGLWSVEVHARIDGTGIAIFRSRVPIR